GLVVQVLRDNVIGAGRARLIVARAEHFHAQELLLHLGGHVLLLLLIGCAELDIALLHALRVPAQLRQVGLLLVQALLILPPHPGRRHHCCRSRGHAQPAAHRSPRPHWHRQRGRRGGSGRLLVGG